VVIFAKCFIVVMCINMLCILVIELSYVDVCGFGDFVCCTSMYFDLVHLCMLNLIALIYIFFLIQRVWFFIFYFPSLSFVYIYIYIYIYIFMVYMDLS
jgi:hypothetical protein